MHIVTGSDDNYAAGVTVLIASAAFHNPQARFTVLDMGISAENRARIDALGERLGVSVARIEISDNAFDHIRVTRAHLTRGTYLRLLIPDILADEDRALYMDCDMLVTDSLAMLDEIALDDSPLAAVPCPSPDAVELAGCGIAPGNYINAGLLVMNLPVWRREGLAARCIELLTQDRPLMSEDQSAINIVCKGRIVLLPSRFNVYSDPAAYKAVADLPETMAVLHYVVNNKPWHGAAPLGELWQYHAARLGPLLPPPRPMTLRRKLSLMNRQRKVVVGTLLGKAKYRTRHAVLALMQERFVDAYLAARKTP